MRELVTIPAGRPLDTVEAVVQLTREGSRDPRVRAFVQEVARSQGAASMGGGEALIRPAFDALRARFSYVPDPLDLDIVQTPGLTLSNDAGDCDDATALVLAVARSLGLKGRAVLVSRDGPTRHALHVYPEVQLGGAWVPMDLASPTAYGDVPRFDGRIVREAREVDPFGVPGVGFLDAILGGVASIFGASSAKSAAKANERAANAQAAATKHAADQDARATIIASNDAKAVALEQNRLDEKRLRASVAATRSTLQLVQDLAPAALVLIGLKVAAPLIGQVLARVS